MRIPPVIQLLFWMAVAWVIHYLTPQFGLTWPYRTLAAIGLLIFGIVIAILGAFEFRKFKTTLNPVILNKAETLVTSGIFKVSRNPMYLGMLLILSGWIVYLSNPASATTAFGFVLIMNMIQIKPEEHIMKQKFGDVYEAYMHRTRRWL